MPQCVNLLYKVCSVIVDFCCVQLTGFVLGFLSVESLGAMPT